MENDWTMIIRNDDDTHRVTGSRASLQFVYEAITIAGMHDDAITIVVDGREWSALSALSAVFAPANTYHVNDEGSIEDQDGGLLYEAHSIELLSPAAKQRLAELHSADEDLQWEGSIAEGRRGAWDILIAEGLMVPQGG